MVGDAAASPFRSVNYGADEGNDPWTNRPIGFDRDGSGDQRENCGSQRDVASSISPVMATMSS